MKRFLMLLILTGFINEAYSQTKEDVEQWITYNMNKYFGSDYSYQSKLLSLKMGLPSYSYHDYHYYFSKGTFAVNTQNVTIDTFNRRDVKTDLEFIAIWRIIKVEVDSNIAPYSFTSGRVNLIFSNPAWNNNKVAEQSVRIYDYETMHDKTDDNSYRNSYFFITTDEETIKSGILSRLKKAFEKIAQIEGAHVIKDLF